MKPAIRVLLRPLAAAALAVPMMAAAQDAAPVINPPPTAKDWAAIGKLPDWSGVWIPDTPDPREMARRTKANPAPWNDKAAARIAKQNEDRKAGHPDNIFANCLPEGMPTWMMISNNAMEIAFTPGRIYFLGESDGNRLRRIYTDGRPHPANPDPTSTAIPSVTGKAIPWWWTPSASCPRSGWPQAKPRARPMTATCTWSSASA